MLLIIVPVVIANTLLVAWYYVLIADLEIFDTMGKLNCHKRLGLLSPRDKNVSV